jgi:hypothetical protein
MTDSRERRSYLVGLLRGSLRGHSEGKTHLPRLVSDVESLIDSLEPVAPSGWVNQLRSEWAELEILHALMLAEGRTDLTQEEQREVSDVVNELDALLANAGLEEEG